ncbi:MAG: Sua5/YciO/YrdC/YwlC family protein, partial [Pseudohongiellaceae bacterium]
MIAYPTEAVWGLGCDPWNQNAVLRLLSIKKRPVGKGLILVAASVDQIFPIYKNLSRPQQDQLDKAWPSPRTWLIPDPDNWIPMLIKGAHTSVAVRISDHPLVSELCQRFGGPIVSTSANTAGKAEIRSRLRLLIALGAKL